jgi:geranylgeranyl pyrophosphate synthase
VLATEPAGDERAARRALAAARVARAAGSIGMVGGQVLDLEGNASGSGAGPDPGVGSELGAALEDMHRRKTGALIGAALAVGGIHAGLKPPEVDRLEAFGLRLGLAFQAVDDILDVEGTSADLGKTAGKDAAARKLTYPALLGLAGARRAAEEHIAEALRLLEGFGAEASVLRALAGFVLARRS